MTQQKFCKDCIQKHNCQRIYKQLGDSPGPSVTCNVILAFLLPLIVFIVCLTIFENLLADKINTGLIRAVIVLVPAMLTALVCMLITKVIKN